MARSMGTGSAMLDLRKQPLMELRPSQKVKLGNDRTQQTERAQMEARGVAEANSIIGESLKDNPAYLQYLWITEGEKDSNRTVYMVPSNGGAPVPTFDIQN